MHLIFYTLFVKYVVKTFFFNKAQTTTSIILSIILIADAKYNLILGENNN